MQNGFVKEEEKEDFNMSQSIYLYEDPEQKEIDEILSSRFKPDRVIKAYKMKTFVNPFSVSKNDKVVSVLHSDPVKYYSKGREIRMKNESNGPYLQKVIYAQDEPEQLISAFDL